LIKSVISFDYNVTDRYGKYFKGLVDAHQSIPEACQIEVLFKMKNANALHIIQLSCGRQIQDELCHFELAKDAWSHLSVVYGKTLKINLDKLQQGVYLNVTATSSGPIYKKLILDSFFNCCI
jgi:hypothetical protein